METTNQRVSFDASEDDLKKVLTDMGIPQLIGERLPEAEQERALTEILPTLRGNLETRADSPANKTGSGHASVRVGSYYFQFKNSFYLVATPAAGRTAFAVFNPASASIAMDAAIAPHVLGALRGVNEVLVKLKPQRWPLDATPASSRISAPLRSKKKPMSLSLYTRP